MEAPDELLVAIRSLHSPFQVLHWDASRIDIAFSSFALAGIEGPHTLSFSSPRMAWAMQWDAAVKKWVERSELSNPTSGLVAEAFVKRAGDGYSLSFSDRSTPLVRWGFYAGSIAALAAEA